MTKYSPLHAFHIARGAKLADFGGWEMPIEYPASAGGGVLAEHQAVRERVGLFDVSHLGKARIKGRAVRSFINTLFTNDVDRIGPGQAQYTLLCDDVTGGVVDDLILYLRSDEEIFLVPNAANCAEVVRRITEAAPREISVTNHHEDFGVFAIQGPLASALLSKLSVNVELEYMSFTEMELAGADVIICRTGYTGEHGYELIVPWDDSERVWNLLVEKVEAIDGRVAGLGARDTLRTEMCYPLHGHELSLEITPVQAGASWAVGWKKEKFAGKEKLEDERSRGPRRKLHSLVMNTRGIPRQGMSVIDSTGREIGVITSGTFSPTLKKGIALALLAGEHGVGSHLRVDIRGTLHEAVTVKGPFVPSHVK